MSASEVGKHLSVGADVKRRHFIAGAIAGMAACGCRPGGKGDRAIAADGDRVDDTAELQAALNRGGHITLERGRRYNVSAPAGASAALVIHSDTFLDLADAMLELAPGQRCPLISTQKSERSRNIRIGGGEIVGNGARQPTDFIASIGITPTLYLTNCDRLELRDLKMHDTYMYAVYAQGDDGAVDNLTIEQATGGGLHVTGAHWRIDRIDVRNVTYFDDVNCQGNPFIVNLRDSTVGSIQCENYGFGVKFQDGCENVTVNSILAIGGHNNDKNPDYLVKVQGMNDSRGKRFNHGIRIGSIVAQNGPLCGLYIIYSDGVDIGFYHGKNNARLPQEDEKYGSDLLVIDADNVHFGILRLKGIRRYGLWIDDKVGQFSADTVDLEGTQGTDAIPIVMRSGSAILGRTALRGFGP